MADRSDTWMPLYIGDYLSATTRLTTEQHGAYFLLLMDYWRNGPPPNDDAVLAQIAKATPQAWRKLKPGLMSFFEERDGLLIQRRVERERARADGITEKRQKAGKASAEARAKGQQKANTCSTSVGTHVEADAQHMSRPSQSHIPLSNDNGGNRVSAEDPEAVFWKDAKAWLKPRVKGDPGALINKWMREHGKEMTHAAVSAAQLQNAVDPPAYVSGYFRRHASQSAATGWDGLP